MPAEASIRATVLTDDTRAATAGADAMKAGGNAIDAVVAAAMVHCVISPSKVGFGGYGSTLAYWSAQDRKCYTTNSDARAPLAFKPDLFTKVETSKHGYLAIGVPGVTAGFDLALRKFGKRSFKQNVAAALDYAENGQVVSEEQARELANFSKTTDDDSRHEMFHGKPTPKAGEKWVQTDLAGLIRAIEDNPRSLYEGPIAKKIVSEIQAHGGVLTEDDFAKFQAELNEPLHITYRGFDLYTPPPPSGGITSLSILKTLEQFPLEQFPASEYKPWGPQYYDLFLDATKLCWRERDEWLGDPEFVKVPYDRMLSVESAKERAKQILKGVKPTSQPSRPAGQHTVNVVAVDPEGNCASYTVTHGDGFGSKVAIKGLGLVIGHGMSRFTYDGESPNAPQPGKRMQHNMCPAIATMDGKPRFVVGLPGGPRIVTVTAQMLVSLIDFHATALQASRAPRVHVESEEPCQLSPGVSPAIEAYLVSRGHQIKRFPFLGGCADAAIINPRDGSIDASNSFAPRGIVNLPAETK